LWYCDGYWLAMAQLTFGRWFFYLKNNNHSAVMIVTIYWKTLIRDRYLHVVKMLLKSYEMSCLIITEVTILELF